MLNKENAITIGRINAMLYLKPEFYCVTGKVKPDDIIAFMPGKRQCEVAVSQKKVKQKTKDFYKSEAIEINEDWHDWL